VRVTFYLPGEPDPGALRLLDPDRDWREFKRGERMWVLQTYLRLVRAGHLAELSDAPEGEGLIVLHAKHRRDLLRARSSTRGAVVVAIRADNREAPIADFEVVQNGRFADGRRRFFVPLWPQPGLVPRDPARGTRIERAAFKGFDQSLHPDLRSPAWTDYLAGVGIEWVHDSVEFAGVATDRRGVAWADYRDIDLVVAVRPEHSRLYTWKPATKLYNAWLAGVPAILGPEYAYREQRRSELDYIEVRSLGEAKAAVERLLRDPGLYETMVENGRRRAVEFTAEAILPRWSSLLYEKLPAATGSRRHRVSRWVPRGARLVARRLARLAAWRPAQ
jgi:hypothetical protein